MATLRFKVQQVMMERPPDEAPVTFGELRRAVAMLLKYVHAETGYVNAFNLSDEEADKRRIEWTDAAKALEEAFGIQEVWGDE